MGAISEYILGKVVSIGVTSFVLVKAAPTIFGAGMFWLFYPREAPPQPEPLSGFLGKLEKLAQRKVHTKSGTYRITAPTPEYLTKREQQKLCQYYVKRYEETHNTWTGAVLDGRFIKRACGINLDDIVNNTRGGNNN